MTNKSWRDLCFHFPCWSHREGRMILSNHISIALHGYDDIKTALHCLSDICVSTRELTVVTPMNGCLLWMNHVFFFLTFYKLNLTTKVRNCQFSTLLRPNMRQNCPPSCLLFLDLCWNALILNCSYKAKLDMPTNSETGRSYNSPKQFIQGGLFNCSHPKISKCQPVSKLRPILRTVPTLKKTKKEKS